MLKILLFILFLIIITVFIIGWHFSSIIISPIVAKYNYTYEQEVEKGKIEVEEFNKLKKQEVYLDSDYGYKIHCLFFPNKEVKKSYNIMSWNNLEFIWFC